MSFVVNASPPSRCVGAEDDLITVAAVPAELLIKEVNVHDELKRARDAFYNAMFEDNEEPSDEKGLKKDAPAPSIEPAQRRQRTPSAIQRQQILQDGGNPYLFAPKGKDEDAAIRLSASDFEKLSETEQDEIATGFAAGTVIMDVDDYNALTEKSKKKLVEKVPL